MVKGVVDIWGAYHIFSMVCLFYVSCILLHTKLPRVVKCTRFGDTVCRIVAVVGPCSQCMRVLRLVYFTTHQFALCSKVNAIWRCCVSLHRRKMWCQLYFLKVLRVSSFRGKDRKAERESAREREHERSERGVFACLQFSVKHTHMTLTHSIHTIFTHSIYI